MPAPAARWLEDSRLPFGRLTDEDALIHQYLAGGRIPWSPGYGEYRLRCVVRILEEEASLRNFRESGLLPQGYGYRLDERVVEYPWVFSRARDWGPRVLDAGSTLNNPTLLATPMLRTRQIIVYDLKHDWIENRAGISYITGDLRNIVLRDEDIDVVVCISTLEHIGLDNTFLYSRNPRYRENRPSDFNLVLREFRRVLRPGGTLLVTVPCGKAMDLGWLQQFDREGIEAIIRAFAGTVVDVSYFKYEPGGWVRSTAADCASCEYFDIHAKGRCDPDFAAAARAVACIEMVKPD